MQGVPESHEDLLADERRAYAFLATVMADGSPQVTPVWFDTEGEYLRVNSAEGRVKDANMRERPEVAMVIMGLDDPYRYLQARGKVVEVTTEGGAEHINKLSRKYDGHDFNIPRRQVRVIYKIEPRTWTTG